VGIKKVYYRKLKRNSIVEWKRRLSLKAENKKNLSCTLTNDSGKL